MNEPKNLEDLADSLFKSFFEEPLNSLAEAPAIKKVILDKKLSEELGQSQEEDPQVTEKEQ